MVVSLHTVLPSSTLCTEQTQFAIFRTVVDKQIILSAISSMLNAQPSPVMSPETKELTVSPTNGLAPTPRPDDLKLPLAVTQCVPSMQPLVQFESQLLAILSDIDATPSPVASPATQQSVVTSPLTERALRYHRRDALRTDRNNVASVPSPYSTDPPHALGTEMHQKGRSDFTPAPPRKLFHPTIPNTIPSLNHEQYRSPSFHSLPRMHSEFNAPATFPRATRATYMTEQRSLSAGLRSLPRVLPPPAPLRAFRSMSSSSTTSSASASKTAAAGSRPSASETAPARQAAHSGHPQGTSSPVASSTLRETSGSGTDRTRGLRPDSPVPSRVPMGGPYGPPAPPAHLCYLNEVWDATEPALRARLGSVTPQDAETSLERARATANVEGPGRTAADACALSLAEEEYANVLLPLQARAASLAGEHADLSGRLRLNVTQQRSTAADMAAVERHHLRVTSTFGAGSQQPPPARATTRSAVSVAFSVPAASTGSTAPPAPPAAGSTMPPPPPPAARVPFTTAAQWSTVAARRPRQPPPTPRDDRYLDLRISRLMHINSFSPQSRANPLRLWPPKWRRPLNPSTSNPAPCVSPSNSPQTALVFAAPSSTTSFAYATSWITHPPPQRAQDGYRRYWMRLPPLADRLRQLLLVVTPRLPRDRVAAPTLRADAATPKGLLSRRRRTATTAIYGIKAATIRTTDK